MNYNLLFVDDDKWITDSMKDILEWETLGLNPPYLAYSALEAQEIIQAAPIHIIISDIEMLETDGFALISWVQEHYPEILRIFLTNHARFDYAQKAIHAGIYEYLLKPINARMLEELLQKCILKLQNQSSRSPAQQQKKYSKAIVQAIEYIDSHLSSPLSRDMIARELFISESNLSRSFAKEVGATLVEYINARRLEKAKELLRTTDLSVTEICLQIGYNYTAYFTKIFKEKEGMTPTQYRIMNTQ